MKRILIFFGLALFSIAAHAHKSSDSYLSLQVDGAKIRGQWDIALRDLDYAIGLDRNQDGVITWGELHAKHTRIADYALARLRLHADAAPCPAHVTQQMVDHHSDGAYTVIRFHGDCKNPPMAITVDYRLFFDLDPQHRGLLQLKFSGSSRSAIFSPDRTRQNFTLRDTDPWRQFLDYTRLGIWHIGIGIDHILFLLALLLPSVVRREAGRWHAVNNLRQATWEIFKIVTAFTLAHSVTLSLATLGVISLPARWVESTIAASIVLAALNNVYPVFKTNRWVIAFCFGLIHGFGFSSVLGDLGLTNSNLWLALLGFNVGVEIGQLAIVIAFIPIAYWLRQTFLYQRLIMVLGSVMIGLLGFIWMLERAFDFRFLPMS